MFYKLIGKKLIKCNSLTDTSGPVPVAQDVINNVKISTVFMAIDHNYGDGQPILFETMIFGGKYDGDQWRYSTYEEAETGHQMAFKLIAESEVSIDSTMVKPKSKTIQKIGYRDLDI